MNTIYLVCTRSAITASALTYIINSSPDCYNLSHNNLWLTEESEWFGTAHIINDWWNVNDHLKNNGYDAEFRNTDRLTEQQLLQLNQTWQEMNTGKDICLFTHARNVSEIIKIKNLHCLPVKVITTKMGQGSYQFLSGILRREFNTEMNDYRDLLSAWDHIYNQLTGQDFFWEADSEVTFQMRDWLLDTDVATGWPDTIGDGEKVEILGGTCIQTAGTNPSVGVSRVTINQTSYFDTKALATAWKVGTTGTAFLSFTDGLSQTSLGYDNAMVIPSDGHLRSIIVMTDVTQTGFTFSLVNQGGSNIYVSSSQSLTANVATTITPGSAAITKSSDKTVHFKMVRATSASNNASIIVTLVFEWDI